MERYRAQDAVAELADLAARAVCEPRRFMENEDELQQRLGEAVARVRLQQGGAVEALRALEAEARKFFAGGDYSGMYRATQQAGETLDRLGER